MSSFKNRSAERYITLDAGERRTTSWAIACMRWVLPSPTPPYRKRGLYERDGDSATARAAACANWFEDPTTNVSNVNRGFRTRPRGGPTTGAGGTRTSAAIGRNWIDSPGNPAAAASRA